MAVIVADKYRASRLECIAKDAKALGVEIINCTPGGALEVFPRADIAKALA